jgi:peptidoglycan biosynthesis protein MviN/MurJ (putative lipid II flippase)
MILNIVLNVILVGPYGYKGLAVATSISYAANFAVLYILLGQRFGALWDRAFSGALLRMTVAAVAMAAVAYAAYLPVLGYFPEDTLLSRASCVVIPMVVAIIVYLSLAWYFGIPELRSFAKLLARTRRTHG